jgi:hypothetical protein
VRVRWLALLVLVCAGAQTLAGCTTTVVRSSVERRVERRLSSLVGPAAWYRVRILGTRDPDVVQGRARRVEIEGRRIRALEQVTLENLKLSLFDVQYDPEELYRFTVRRSDLEIEVTDRALTQFLQKRLPRYRPYVEFEPDQVLVSMQYRLFGTPSTLKARGRLVVEEGRRLLFEAENHPDDAAATAVEQVLGEKLNPLLDLTGLDIPCRLEYVQVMDGRLRAHGTAALPD